MLTDELSHILHQCMYCKTSGISNIAGSWQELIQAVLMHHIALISTMYICMSHQRPLNGMHRMSYTHLVAAADEMSTMIVRLVKHGNSNLAAQSRRIAQG